MSTDHWPHPFLKTQWCDFHWRSHGCRWGDKCWHAHSIYEYKGRQDEPYFKWYLEEWNKAGERYRSNNGLARLADAPPRRPLRGYDAVEPPPGETLPRVPHDAVGPPPRETPVRVPHDAADPPPCEIPVRVPHDAADPPPRGTPLRVPDDAADQRPTAMPPAAKVEESSKAAHVDPFVQEELKKLDVEQSTSSSELSEVS